MESETNGAKQMAETEFVLVGLHDHYNLEPQVTTFNSSHKSHLSLFLASI